MSHIPSSAMPHAQARPEDPTAGGESAGPFARVAEKVREYPKTAAAAGAAVAAGIAAAAAIPALRGRSRTSGKDKATGNKKKS